MSSPKSYHTISLVRHYLCEMLDGDYETRATILRKFVSGEYHSDDEFKHLKPWQLSSVAHNFLEHNGEEHWENGNHSDDSSPHECVLCLSDIKEMLEQLQYTVLHGGGRLSPAISRE